MARWSILPVIFLQYGCFVAVNAQYASSRATFYGSPDCLGTPGGACGYGAFGKDVNGGNVACASQLYRNGSGCGACYQVRCKDAEVCSPQGVKIMVTDYGQGDRTDFIMSLRGYTKMAISSNPYAAKCLIARGVVDVEYTRIPCEYPGKSMMIKIDESSKNPGYLAIIFLYKGGKKDIVSVEVCAEGGYEWRSLCRNHGAVWDIISPPKGALKVRIRVVEEASGDVQLMVLPNPIPASWCASTVIDSSLQLS